MKKVLSIIVAVALVLSCCVVAFASEVSNLSRIDFITYLADWTSTGDSAADLAQFTIDNGIYDTSTDVNAPVTTEEMIQIFVACVKADPQKLSVDTVNTFTSALAGVDYDNVLTSDQKTEIDASVANAVAEPADPGTDSGDDSGSGLPFDLSKITDIFSNLGGNIDLSQFLEGAKSGIGQLLDGIKGAGLPDISGLTGLLGNIPGLDMIMGLFGGGGDDGGNGGGSGTTPSPYTPSTNPSGGNSNSQVIPKTADTAPIAAVATLAVVAGVAFVLTRKKNED